MKTKLITTIIISLLVASSPICSAGSAGSLIKGVKVFGKIIETISKRGSKVPKMPPLPKIKTPSAPPSGSFSEWTKKAGEAVRGSGPAAHAIGRAVRNDEENRNNSEEN